MDKAGLFRSDTGENSAFKGWFLDGLRCFGAVLGAWCLVLGGSCLVVWQSGCQVMLSSCRVSLAAWLAG